MKLFLVQDTLSVYYVVEEGVIATERLKPSDLVAMVAEADRVEEGVIATERLKLRQSDPRALPQ